MRIIFSHTVEEIEIDSNGGTFLLDVIQSAIAKCSYKIKTIQLGDVLIEANYIELLKGVSYSGEVVKVDLESSVIEERAVKLIIEKIERIEDEIDALHKNMYVFKDEKIWTNLVFFFDSLNDFINEVSSLATTEVHESREVQELIDSTVNALQNQMLLLQQPMLSQDAISVADVLIFEMKPSFDMLKNFMNNLSDNGGESIETRKH